MQGAEHHPVPCIGTFPGESRGPVPALGTQRVAQPPLGRATLVGTARLEMGINQPLAKPAGETLIETRNHRYSRFVVLVWESPGPRQVPVDIQISILHRDITLNYK